MISMREKCLTQRDDSHAKYLNAGANDGSKQLGIFGGSENVTVNQFPARFFEGFVISFVLIISIGKK